MENPVNFICDGVVCDGGNGFEDQFGGSFFFGTGSISLYSSKWGDSVGSALQSFSGFSPAAADDVMVYKFFTSEPGDNLFFSNDLSALWTNPAGYPVTVRALITYWTVN